MILKKRNNDVIDLTDMQRRGIIAKAQEISKNENVSYKGEFIDLSQKNETPAFPTFSPDPTPTQEQATSQESSPFDFLSNLASSAEPSQEPTKLQNAEPKELQHLQVKIEDLEYKFDRLIERLEKIESMFKEK